MAYDQAAANNQPPFLIVGTYTEPMNHCPNARGKGITVFRMEFASSSVNFVPVTTMNNLSSPAFLDISRNKKYLYAISEIASENDSNIHAFEISRDGVDGRALRHEYLGAWRVGGTVAAHVVIDPADRFVFVSNYVSGDAVAFKIDPSTGKLEKKNFHHFTEHSDVVKERQEASHMHSCLIDARMKYVYFADLGNDCVYAFDYSSETGFANGTLRKFPTPPGAGPRHMAVDPINGRYMYVACELSNHLLVYKVGDDGSLEQIQYVPTTTTTTTTTAAPTEQNSTNPSKAVSDIHVSPDGKFVYIATRFVDVMSVFRVSEAGDGKVQLVQEIPTQGKVPRNFALYDAKGLALVGNQETHDIAVFNKDSGTGKLTYTKSFPVDTPVCIKILE